MRRLVGALLVGCALGGIVAFAFIARLPFPGAFWGAWRIDDLLLHAVAFAFLSAAVALWRPVTGRAVTGMAVSAALVEALQSLLPGRTASMADFGASLFGIGVGTVLCRLAIRSTGGRAPL